ncbi:MAG: hypothetical protein EOO93_19805 [Pedobacter sp.]|nr:MAG: hypothetical protein EOO93_19805 [Pedobacter sp.]
MKNYTKLMASAAAAIAIFVSTNVNAQTASEPTNPSRQKLGVGINAGVPTNSGSSFALGVDLRYQVDLDRQLSIPITAGFTSIFNKDITVGNTTVSVDNSNYIPVKAGLKYFFNDSGSGAYGLAEAGAAFLTAKGAGTAFTYSPAIGYAWSNGLDLGAKYEGISKDGANNGYVGLRLAYGFKL